ncbi:hypothetical protein PRIPAC_93674 [Pristionchus pacificus]|uniref:Uncharacterized protein n=1 Tax=Pristionchus pacificus TaxID=54126 RepID=A0A2A6CIL0_PRIPA|nr:hypothetical protein PRIPAC_93674 [Pristionchus pacificus]|eukprot:PDM77893.1 hypothetical protein PRIPAC_34760 [Pristionchus pacificus]
MRPTYRCAKRLALRTVFEQRQEAEANASERADVKHADLVVCLKVLFDLQTPESCRESLAANMPWLLTVHSTEWGTSRRVPFRAKHFEIQAVNWIINTCWERLPKEGNPKVRCSLFRMGARMLKRRPFTCSVLMTNATAINSMLEVVEQEELSKEELKLGLDLLGRILQKVTVATDVVHGERLIRMGLRMIERHCTIERLGSSTRTMFRVVVCMTCALDSTLGPSPWVAIIVDHAVALPYILGTVRRPTARMHEPLMGLLELILECAPLADRVTMVIRHYTRLVQAFHQMRSDQLLSFMEHSEFAGIVTTTPSLLRLIYTRSRHDCQVQSCDEWNEDYDDYDDYCQIATFVMESALVADKVLQEILGYGFLSVARHFAAHEVDSDERHAETFRRILAAHPEFSQQFKQLTCDGEAGNLVAEIGRAIPDKKKTQGTWYIWEEAYEDM